MRPGHTLAAGAWIGVYLGELLPSMAPEAETSDYAFTLPAANKGAREVVVDVQTHGNWTRFVNSCCRPNVEATLEQVGGVRVVALRVVREIKGGEEVVICYGRRYFEGRKMVCRCKTPGRGRRRKDGGHLPPNGK